MYGRIQSKQGNGMKENSLIPDNKTDLMPTDTYRFLNQEISIRSNSPAILEHYKLMYERFYVGSAEYTAGEPQKADTLQFIMHIVDNLDSSNELLIEDNFSLYRLSKLEDSYKYTYQDILNPSWTFDGFSEPLSLMSIALLRAISRLLNKYALFHAGAVSWNGDGIIFPAPANMGKTTFVLKLLQRGFKFLSDEIACLNPHTNLLEPFPRAVNVRGESRHLLGLSMIDGSVATFQSPSAPVHTIDIEEIAENSLSLPSEPRYLIFLKGFGEKPRLENISPSHALFNLIQFVLSTAREPSSLLLKLAPVVDNLQCFNLVMGDIDATADLIMDLLNETSSTGRTSRHVS